MTTGTLKTDPNVFSLQTLPTVFGKSTQLCQLRQLYHSSFVYISISWINSFLINPVNTDNWLKYFPTPELTVLRKSTQLCQLKQLDLSNFVYIFGRIVGFCDNLLNFDNWLKCFLTLALIRKFTQLCQLRQPDLSSIDRIVKIYSTLTTDSNVF